jgi:hypothetical protein
VSWFRTLLPGIGLIVSTIVWSVWARNHPEDMAQITLGLVVIIAVCVAWPVVLLVRAVIRTTGGGSLEVTYPLPDGGRVGARYDLDHGWVDLHQPKGEHTMAKPAPRSSSSSSLPPISDTTRQAAKDFLSGLQDDLGADAFSGVFNVSETGNFGINISLLPWGPIIEDSIQ